MLGNLQSGDLLLYRCLCDIKVTRLMEHKWLWFPPSDDFHCSALEKNWNTWKYHSVACVCSPDGLIFMRRSVCSLSLSEGDYSYRTKQYSSFFSFFIKWHILLNNVIIKNVLSLTQFPHLAFKILLWNESCWYFITFSIEIFDLVYI